MCLLGTCHSLLLSLPRGSGPQRTPTVFVPFTLVRGGMGTSVPVSACSEGLPVRPWVFTPVQVYGGWSGACPSLKAARWPQTLPSITRAPSCWCLTSALCSWPQAEAEEPQDVVVYDQSTRDASVLAADSFLSILLSKLDGCFDSVAILTGELPGPGGMQDTSPLASLTLICLAEGWEGGQGHPGVGVPGGSTPILLSKPRDQCCLGQWFCSSWGPTVPSPGSPHFGAPSTSR